MDIKTIIRKVAIKERVNENDVKIAYEHFIKQWKSAMTSEDMPKVLIHNFGTFSVSLVRLENQMRHHINRYLKGTIEKPELKELLEPLFKVRKRLKDEQKSKSKISR